MNPRPAIVRALVACLHYGEPLRRPAGVPRRRWWWAVKQVVLHEEGRRLRGDYRKGRCQGRGALVAEVRLRVELARARDKHRPRRDAA